MEQSRQKISSVGRDNVTQVGNKGKLSIDNRQNTTGDRGWLKALPGKIIVGVIIGVLVAIIVAYLQIG